MKAGILLVIACLQFGCESGDQRETISLPGYWIIEECVLSDKPGDLAPAFAIAKGLHITAPVNPDPKSNFQGLVHFHAEKEELVRARRLAYWTSVAHLFFSPDSPTHSIANPGIEFDFDILTPSATGADQLVFSGTAATVTLTKVSEEKFFNHCAPN